MTYFTTCGYCGHCAKIEALRGESADFFCDHCGTFRKLDLTKSGSKSKTRSKAERACMLFAIIVIAYAFTFTLGSFQP